jgi:NNP family nitrate/nitrite transporter-like MFS transporter
MGFATFGILAALAFGLVAVLHQQWLAWALPHEQSAVQFETSMSPAE